MSAGPGTTLFESYRPDPGRADELLDDRRALREHWSEVGSALDSLGLDGLHLRLDDVRRLLEADGASYRIRASDRAEPWRLDPVPLLISAAEWTSIEHGVEQRARLLDLILRDLYGERQLLARGIIPPEVVFRHHGFVAAADGTALPDGSQLFTYAVDLGRDVNGRFAVLADHAQAPSGSGYALENRAVLSHVFPSLLRQAGVDGVAPYFRTLRSGLEALAEQRSWAPRIVVLSAGPNSEAAFEHGFLASYLGYGLVEGSDLVVVDGAVHMRALGGLERVDVIVRRVDASFSDPLELRGDSRLGVPGLLEAGRRGSVVVVNPIGSAAVENPALLPYLPAAAEALLGESLAIESVPTFWCGDQGSLSHVLASLESFSLHRFGANGADDRSVHPAMLSSADQETLRGRIAAEPGAWTAQHVLPLSTSPTLDSRGLYPGRTIFRTYAVAGGGRFHVMTGGLTRVAPDAETTVVSNQEGAVAKDTWVLAAEAERPALSWQRPELTDVVADAFDRLPERAAENLFWVARYAERAEAVARLLREVYDRRFDQAPSDDASARALGVLLDSLASVTQSPPIPYSTHGGGAGVAAELDVELAQLASNVGRPGSLAFAVSSLLGAAEAVRDRLSVDTRHVIGALDRSLVALTTTSPDRQDVVDATLSSVMGSLLALQGLAGESMVRDDGWYFLDAGRRIERFVHLSSILRVALGQQRSPAIDGLVLESVLVSAESIVTYRRRYRARPRVDAVLELLLSDPDNPRSLRFQLDRLEEAIDALGPIGLGAPSGPAVDELLADLSPRLVGLEVDSLSRPNPDGQRSELLALLDHGMSSVLTAADTIAEACFTQQLPQQPIGQDGQR